MNRFLGRRTGRKVAFVGLLSAVVSGLAGTAAAHEEYVVGDEQSVEAGEFLAEALTDPSVIGPLLAGALAFAGFAVPFVVAAVLTVAGALVVWTLVDEP